MATKRPEPETPGSYQVVARRFRPQSFEEVVGQDDVLQSLRTAVEQKKVPHAFLFSGSRGVGKTTSARILARCLNCEKGPTATPCGKCDACTSILDGSNPDVVEIDAASNNSIDDVRRLREMVGFATMGSRYRVIILDEAHQISKAAFNALLKTLEEPPPRVVFVLATTELNKVPETIRSRCQVLLFRRVGETDLQKRLAMIAGREGVTIPDDVFAEIAASVRGGVRDAETELERVLPLARELGAKFDLAAYRTMVARIGIDATIGVVETLLSGDAKASLHFAHDLQRRGLDERESLGEIVETLRQIVLLKIDGADSGLVPFTGSLRERLAALAAKVPMHQLDGMISAGLLGRERLRRLEDRAAVLELTLLRMAQAGSLPSVGELIAEVRAGGAVAAPRPAAQAFAPPQRTTAGPAAAPAAAPGAPVPPPTGASDLRSRILAAFQDRQMLQATLEQCRFDGPNANGVVVLTLHTDRKMHRDRLASPVLQQEITNAISTAAGSKVTVEFRLGGDAPGGAPGAPAAPPVKVDPGPAAKRVLDKFRGRIVEVNPEDRVKKPPVAPADDEGAPVDEPPPDLQE